MSDQSTFSPQKSNMSCVSRNCWSGFGGKWFRKAYLCGRKPSSSSQPRRRLGKVQPGERDAQQLREEMPEKCLRKTGFDCQGPVPVEEKRLQFLCNHLQTRHVFSLRGTQPGGELLLLIYKADLARG